MFCLIFLIVANLLNYLIPESLNQLILKEILYIYVTLL